ncbi:MAG: 2-oxoglutarate dehydrogenase E1 component [Crocinitomicaceae bacterium]|nr:2-oxoglutarate dehydrogenase E1 component [Crocinitomicaceae bacterium]|tara:strand:+ start:8769 stop:11474 length:2706 start_codon:yes stop_codon:yes gene_type:complete
MDKFSYLSNGDVNAVEDLYQQYKKDPDSVEFGWRKFFEGFEFSNTHYEEQGEVPANFVKEFKVKELIEGYRTRGHLFTETNPVRKRRQYLDTISIDYFGLTESDLEETFQAGSELGLGPAKLKDIIAYLKQAYCTSIGVEYVYNRKPTQLKWLIERVERNKNTPEFSIDEKKQILHKLNQAVVFENFLHKKFVGQKRFSLEGGESLIPALDTLIESGAELGVEEFVVGMAHRGRLNVLANIFNKTYEEIFSEFQSKEYEDNLFDGDVKYHLGSSAEVKTIKTKKSVHLTLAPNPSHLEAVDPVVEGIARAKIDNYLKDENKIVPILIHGDASIAGQGVVYEVLQMAQLKGYRTGGTVHIVINNQLGFTTNYIDGRSSTYCTDIGKVTLSPVFHVNGDDVEAVVHTMNIAIEFRQKYNKDVFIDLLCYRKYGHNEGDEPRFTQPLLYKTIAKHPNPREIYLQKLLSAGVVEKSFVDEMEAAFRDMLQERLEESKEIQKAKITDFLSFTWKDYKKAQPGEVLKPVKTAVTKKLLNDLASSINTLPEDKKFFKKIVKLFDDRKTMVKEDRLDWALGELLAYATLLSEGHPIRISGQDVERGTFSHRHAVVTLEDSEERYLPLQNIKEEQPPFYIYNSHLSEYGVLGFEYGYAFGSPGTLVIWEAQFGDFNNGAQIIIDQFISAAEDKWNSMNGLVMLLPHGYEGQGAEHSSARLERYLQLCAEENIQVVNPTTPGNYFHLLRRQMKRNFRKPLIVFTPKSLLRHPKCVSTIDDLAKGQFQEVLEDTFVDAKKVKRVVFCTGKLYYDLLAAREENGKDDVALVRLEQLYPFPQAKVDEVVKKYKGAKVFWAQEEPENMGAYTYLLRTWKNTNFEVISRLESGSPASGSSEVFKRRQEEITTKVFE